MLKIQFFFLLQAHKNLTKAEKKALCGLIDVKKLTTEMSMHAAQNEQLPLRMVVQILFFEQVKSQTANNHHAGRSSHEISRRRTLPEAQKSLRKQMDEMRIKEGEPLENVKTPKRGSSAAQLAPSRSRRIFDRLWGMGKGIGSGENKSRSSETSGSSQSPISMVQREGKASGAGSRNRRHSIS